MHHCAPVGRGERREVRSQAEEDQVIEFKCQGKYSIIVVLKYHFSGPSRDFRITVLGIEG